MAFPETLNPATPVNTATVASVPGYIRALAQFLADAFGFPTTLNAAAFSVTAGGIVTIAQPGATLAADPTSALGIASKQYVDARTGAGGGFNSTVLGSPVSIGTSVTTVLSLSLTAPASGGPYRLLASYAVALTASGSAPPADFRLYDGTSTFGYSTVVPLVGAGVAGVNAMDISPGTYAAGTPITLNLGAKTAGGAGSLSAAVSSATGLYTTFLRGLFIPAS